MTSLGLLAALAGGCIFESPDDDDETVVAIEPTPVDDVLPDDEGCACAPDNDDIYVLSDTGTIWSFDPTTYEFTFITDVVCGGMSNTFSMGVSRKGRAWIEYQNGDLYTVDLKDPGSPCKDPGFVNDDPLFPNFGMAFVSNSADDKCDRIYGNHYNGVAMGKDASEFFSVDPVTLGLVQLGKSDYGLAEVTGTGDGRAFLFAGPDPADLVEVDKATGDTIATIPLPGVKTGGGFAFAFFAGDFYFFTDAESDMTSEVTHIDYDDSDNNGKQDIKQVVDNAPISIVGAGVSTCAPTAPQ